LQIATFESVFTAPELQLPWYLLPGNHDHDGNITGQLAYSFHSTRWKFPSLYYTVEFSQFATLLVMIDTVSLDLGDPVQLTWIEQQLSLSQNYTWVIVAGHYPIYSVALHGPTLSLQKLLLPLLEQYNVGAYFCGHDHDLQNFIIPGSKVGWFHTGAGHTAEYNQDHAHSVPPGSLRFFWPPNPLFYVQSGFIQVNVSFDSLNELLYVVNHPNSRVL